MRVPVTQAVMQEARHPENKMKIMFENMEKDVST
jgi:hypothetical protein